jgi:hypothetical protein
LLLFFSVLLLLSQASNRAASSSSSRRNEEKDLMEIEDEGSREAESRKHRNASLSHNVDELLPLPPDAPAWRIALRNEWAAYIIAHPDFSCKKFRAIQQLNSCPNGCCSPACLREFFASDDFATSPSPQFLVYLIVGPLNDWLAYHNGIRFDDASLRDAARLSSLPLRVASGKCPYARMILFDTFLPMLARNPNYKACLIALCFVFSMCLLCVDFIIHSSYSLAIAFLLMLFCVQLLLSSCGVFSQNGREDGNVAADDYCETVIRDWNKVNTHPASAAGVNAAVDRLNILLEQKQQRAQLPLPSALQRKAESRPDPENVFQQARLRDFLRTGGAFQDRDDGKTVKNGPTFNPLAFQQIQSCNKTVLQYVRSLKSCRNLPEAVRVPFPRSSAVTLATSPPSSQTLPGKRKRTRKQASASSSSSSSSAASLSATSISTVPLRKDEDEDEDEIVEVMPKRRKKLPQPERKEKEDEQDDEMEVEGEEAKQQKPNEKKQSEEKEEEEEQEQDVPVEPDEAEPADIERTNILLRRQAQAAADSSDEEAEETNEDEDEDVDVVDPGPNATGDE